MKWTELKLSDEKKKPMVTTRILRDIKNPPISEAGQPSYKVIASNATGLNMLPEIAASITSNHARGHVGAVMATPEESA